MGSVLALVGPVSVYCNWVRSATSDHIGDGGRLHIVKRETDQFRLLQHIAHVVSVISMLCNVGLLLSVEYGSRGSHIFLSDQ